MVLQIFPHARQVDHDGDAERAQMVRRANTRQQEEFGRVDGTRAEEHFVGGRSLVRRAVLCILRANHSGPVAA